MSYQQLTQELRCRIYAMKKAGFAQNQIAAEIPVHPSIISPELSRNSGGRGYRPRQTQCLVDERKQAKHKPRISKQTWQQVETYLHDEQWSPEQISGYLWRHGLAQVSAERIYQHILPLNELAAVSICASAVRESAGNAMAKIPVAGKFRIGAQSKRARRLSSDANAPAIGRLTPSSGRIISKRLFRRSREI